MHANKVCVRIPASTANLGPGFDTLGMALELYAWIEMGVASETRVELYGDQMKYIPSDKNNLIYKVAQQLFTAAGVDYPELEIAMYSDIPLTRGLGSSASAIVGALYAANALIGGRFTDDELFQMATKMENHPDNVGASIFGGIVVAFWDGQRAEHIRIEPHERLELLVAIPDFQLATEKARNILPQQVSMKDAVFNVGHSSVLVAALAAGRLDMLKPAMKDALHQPYRSALIPGMSTLLSEADQHGALGIALSGAGPTIIAFVDRDSPDKAKLEHYLRQTLLSENVPSRTMWLKPDGRGAVLLGAEHAGRTFMDKIKGDIRS